VFEDASQVLPGACRQTDFCVIGGGPIAIAVALGLAKGGHEVMVLPGGGWQERENDRDRYRGFVEPAGSHEPLDENRRRVWGGTGTVWGGRCVPYDAIDFESRDWIPHSGWPIGRAEVESFLPEACAFCDAGKNEFKASLVFPRAPREILSGFENEYWSTQNLERWSPPTNFARHYHAELKRSSKIRILLHGQATHLQLRPDGGSLEHVAAVTRPGRGFRVQAKAFILACGGLENPRLLLASRDVQQNGIGNEYDQVGRYYQSHLFGVCGYAELHDPRRMVYDFERDPVGVYCRRRFWPRSEAQRAWRTGNIIGFFFRGQAGSALHRDAVSSTVFLAKTLLRAAARGGGGFYRLWKEQSGLLCEHARAVWEQAPEAGPRLLRLSLERVLGSRRLPFFLPPIQQGRFPLFYQAEHAPNPQSRVFLSHENLDDLGIPRLVAKIRFSDIDFHTVRTFHREFRRRLEDARVGHFFYDEDALSGQLEKRGGGFNSNAHHIGTTRMSARPAHGVVDMQGRVHGVANLFVAGASIFPTSSHANPTLLAIATSLRLAQHLARGSP